MVYKLTTIKRTRTGAWYLRTKYSIYDTLYPWYTKKQLAQFPIKEKYNQNIAMLVDQMLNLHTQLAEVKNPQAKTLLKRQIEATDAEIDHLVYELYGLTEEEIKIVEER